MAPWYYMSEMVPWYYMSATLGDGGHTPIRPWSDDVPMEDEDGTLYAVATKVPACAIWNLLDVGSGEQVPLLTLAEWLNFLRGRSQKDQERMQLIMVRVLLRARWMDKASQIMYRGWHAALELRRAAERKLEVSVRSLDAARRGGHKDRLMLNEFQRESWSLQLEMWEDVARLVERLAESEHDRKIKAMRVEEITLKDALGRSQAEETRLCEEVTDYRKRLVAVEVLGGILEAGYQKARTETGATTKALADERLANKDNAIRLRKELVETKAANEELRGMLQRGATEMRPANDVQSVAIKTLSSEKMGFTNFGH